MYYSISWSLDPRGVVQHLVIMTTLSTSPSSNTSPSSTISNPESALPTPDLPYTSRRGSLASPSLELLDVPDGPKTVEDVFTASGMPPTLARPPSVSPPADHRPVPLIIPSGTSPSPLTRRSATLPPSSSTRAPPPPPILVRRPTDLGSTIVEVPIPNGISSGSPRSRGLNISGLPELSEAADSLAELIPTPRRTAFGNGASVPASPAWQSLEGPWPTPNRPRPSPSPRPPGRGSLDVARPPLSPLGPKRFEPTPMHGLHSRNLSLFFPQPGEAATGVNTPGTPLFRSPEEVQEAVMIEGTTAFSGNGDWKFGKSNGGGSAVLEPPAGAKRSQRRGHHVWLLPSTRPNALMWLIPSTNTPCPTISSPSSIRPRPTRPLLLLLSLPQAHPPSLNQSRCRSPFPPSPLCRRPNRIRNATSSSRLVCWSSSSAPDYGWKAKCRVGDA